MVIMNQARRSTHRGSGPLSARGQSSEGQSGLCLETKQSFSFQPRLLQALIPFPLQVMSNRSKLWCPAQRQEKDAEAPQDTSLVNAFVKNKQRFT
jgi:hypothetical protein